MSDKLYDLLNKIQRWLPSLGVFYLTLCEIWGLPLGDQINKTIVAIATLLAFTLEVATSIYRKEKIETLENYHNVEVVNNKGVVDPEED